MLVATLLWIALAQDAGAVRAQDPVAGTTATTDTTDGAAGAADGSRRWSILAEPCATARTIEDDGIIVCGDAESLARLPIPGERTPPDRPMPSNPDRSGTGALAAAAAPCATLSGGCPVGIDLFGGATALVRGVGKLIDPDSCCEAPGEATSLGMLVDDIGGLFKRAFGGNRRAEGERVAIDLDAAPPPSASVPILP